MARSKKKAAPEAPRYPLVIETFRALGFYEERQLRMDAPSAFNGDVRFRRYRITVEEIPESAEVLGARLQKLWEESDNHHHTDPLRRAAEAIGYELQGDRGAKRPRR